MQQEQEELEHTGNMENHIYAGKGTLEPHRLGKETQGKGAIKHEDVSELGIVFSAATAIVGVRGATAPLQKGNVLARSRILPILAEWSRWESGTFMAGCSLRPSTARFCHTRVPIWLCSPFSFSRVASV